MAKARKKPVAAKKTAARSKTAGKTTKKKPASKTGKSTKKPKAKASKAKSARSSSRRRTSAKIQGFKPRRLSAAEKKVRADVVNADPSLFGALSEGERADAVRVLTEDARLSEMAKRGRYRVISVEPTATKPPASDANQRLARVIVYDYANRGTADALVNLNTSSVSRLKVSRAQPMLAPVEEQAAVAIAIADDTVKAALGLGDGPQAVLHYYCGQGTGKTQGRSAAVLFGAAATQLSAVAVVDLETESVRELVPADQW